MRQNTKTTYICINKPKTVIRAREGHAQTLLAAQVATGALPSDVTGQLPGADRALLRKMGMSMSNPSQVGVGVVWHGVVWRGVVM